MSVSDGRLPELFPGEWGWFPSPTVAASSLSHEVCREVMAFFLAHLMGMGGKTRVLPGGQAGRASRCPRAQGCIIRLKDRRVGGGGTWQSHPHPLGQVDFGACISSPPQPPATATVPVGLAASPGKRDLPSKGPFRWEKNPKPFLMGVAGCFGGNGSTRWPREKCPFPVSQRGTMRPYKPTGTSRGRSCGEERPGRMSAGFAVVQEVQGIHTWLSVLPSETGMRGIQ